MAEPTIEAERPRRRLRRPGRAGRVLLAVGIALVLMVSGLGVYTLITSEPATLVIYTYPSLFSPGGANCGAPAWSTVFGDFERAHHVTIQVECPPGTLASSLLAQQNAPQADLVIGLDEITAPQAEADHLLVPYTPAALADVPNNLSAQLSPDHAVVPYEWGYLAIDFAASFWNATHGAIARPSFPAFAQNASWARQLLIEDPSVDITGEEFLVWEIEYYQHVLHQDWTGFWKATLPNLPPAAPDWGTAFGEFTGGPGSPQLVVSYSTDPAYAVLNGGAGTFNSTVSWWNGTPFGWRTIYGLGIVAGSRHLSLDQQFENWFLSGTVQNLIPETEWEYPANTTIPLPAEYSAAIDPGSITPLNAYTTPGEVAGNITGWVESWLSLASGGP